MFIQLPLQSLTKNLDWQLASNVGTAIEVDGELYSRRSCCRHPSPIRDFRLMQVLLRRSLEAACFSSVRLSQLCQSNALPGGVLCMARAFRSRNCLSPEAGCSGPADGNDLAEKAAERLTSCSVPSPSLSLSLSLCLALISSSLFHCLSRHKSRFIIPRHCMRASKPFAMLCPGRFVSRTKTRRRRVSVIRSSKCLCIRRQRLLFCGRGVATAGAARPAEERP